MTPRTLIRRSLRFHIRSHFGVVLGAAIGSAALIGALVVGDSVRQTLLERALERLGRIHLAAFTQDRFFDPGLLERMRRDSSSSYTFDLANPAFPSPSGAGLMLSAVVSRQDGTARANQVTVIGVERSVWPGLANWSETARQRWRAGETAFVNEALARQLGVKAGEDLIVRVRKPNALSIEAAITPKDQDTVALRLEVGAVLTPNELGNFSFAVGRTPPANLFLPLEFLSQKLELTNASNLLVTGPRMTRAKRDWWFRQRSKWAGWMRQLGLTKPRTLQQGNARITYRLSDPGSVPVRVAARIDPNLQVEVPDDTALDYLQKSIADTWRPEDVGLSVHTIELPQTATGGEYIQPSVEITSSRIFLEPAIASAALRPRTQLLTNQYIHETDFNDLAFSAIVTNGFGVLTYFANLIRAGDKATPYSMITAAEKPIIPAGMQDDEIIVNEWLAEDLQVKPGDSVQLSYYAVDSGSHLTERTNSFRIRTIVPMRGIYADRTLMPEFPGLAKAESTRDWQMGFPRVYSIRDKDEAYWKAYRGTPKAFVTLSAGQAMWGNRFGTLTAIRYTVPTNTFSSTCREAVYRNLLANLKPSDAGLVMQPVRQQAIRAAQQAQDFDGLFLGFSFFLIIAALLLMALLFQFGLEQRVTEIGTLLALGFKPKQVRRLFLLEGAALAFLGGILGALGGVVYAKAMLWGLATLWRDAIAGSQLTFYASGISLLTGLSASTVVAVLVIWLTLRQQARQPAHQLLAGQTKTPKSQRRSWGKWVGLGAGLAALGSVGWTMASGDTPNAEVFFSAGSLLLIAGLGLAAAWMASLAQKQENSRLTFAGLGVRSVSRRSKRSLATVALLASGAFVVLSIGVFRLDANRDSAKKSSGTGGFALLGESSIPVVKDLNTSEGREFFGLNEKEMAGVTFVPFRVRQGDEASCLNLNRAQKPRLLGVKPDQLTGRFTFSAVEKGIDARKGWQILKKTGSRVAPLSVATNQSSIPEVPAVGDANSIQWALGKKIGDAIDYTDELGHVFKVCLVGAVANSILQGSLIIDETEFVKRFPNESGHRMFLLDVPSNSVSQVSASLVRALQDVGLELTPTIRRLNELNAVQNTYLNTFQVLGGLGLLLGSAGLGVVVLRNVLERRGELGLLMAVGFRKNQLQRLVLSEHTALLGFGLGIGVIAAALAVLPALLSPGSHLPYGSVAVTLAAVFVNGVIWTWLSTRYALRGNLMEALRNE